jgi:hypothetical protein
MKPWREDWPGGKIRPRYAQFEKIKGKLGVGKCSIIRNQIFELAEKFQSAVDIRDVSVAIERGIHRPFKNSSPKAIFRNSQEQFFPSAGVVCIWIRGIRLVETGQS